MKAVVFGGTGFIGSHLVEQLVLAGHEVVAPVRAQSNQGFLRTLDVTIEPIDFSDDSLASTIGEGDIVFNCLANTNLHQSMEQHRRVEVELTCRVLRAAARAGASRYLQLSTVQVYGFRRPAEPIAEDYPVDPQYNYNRISIEREEAVSKLANELGIDCILVRPTNTLAKRDPELLPNLIKLHRSGLFTVLGNGTTRFSCADTRDVGRAMILLAESPDAAGETFLVSGYDTSWIELKEELDRQLGKPSRLIKIPLGFIKPVARLLEAVTPYGRDLPLNRFAVSAMTTTTLFDDGMIRRLGYRPRHTLRDSLSDFLEDTG